MVEGRGCLDTVWTCFGLKMLFMDLVVMVWVRGGSIGGAEVKGIGSVCGWFAVEEAVGDGFGNSDTILGISKEKFETEGLRSMMGEEFKELLSKECEGMILPEGAATTATEPVGF